MFHHLLDSLLQRNAAAGASLAGASHLYEQLACLIIEAIEEYISTVRLDARTNARVQKLLDETNHLAICGLDFIGIFGDLFRLENNCFVVRRREKVENGVENCGIDILPSYTFLESTAGTALTCRVTHT